MTNQNICYCGEYGGGAHTKSARCADSRSSKEKTIAEIISVMESARDHGERCCEDLVQVHVGHICTALQLLKQMQSSHEPAHVPIPLELAKRFHESYERLSAAFGHETRPETRVFDPESPNGKLMIAVCTEILRASQPPPAEALSLLRCVYREVSDFAGVSEETMQAIELHLQSALTKSAEGG